MYGVPLPQRLRGICRLSQKSSTLAFSLMGLLLLSPAARVVGQADVPPAAPAEGAAGDVRKETGRKETVQKKTVKNPSRTESAGSAIRRARRESNASTSSDDSITNPSESEQLRGVVRISWELIDTLVQDDINVDVPFESEISGGRVSGRVKGPVQATLELQQFEGARETIEEEGRERVFVVRAQGTVRGQFQASAGRLRIAGPLSIPFQTERNVLFDGRYFQTTSAGTSASVHLCFGSVRTQRNGPLGRLASRVATPIVRRQQASSERSATPIARQRVADSMEQYTKQFITRLNQVTPLEQSLFKLYPEMADWRIRLVNDGSYLSAHYAPPGSPPVKLPEAPHEAAGIEIWIRTTAAEARLLERLGQWRMAQELLKKYLPEEGSDAGKLTSETTAQSFGPWFALLIGRLR